MMNGKHDIDVTQILTRGPGLEASRVLENQRLDMSVSLHRQHIIRVRGADLPPRASPAPLTSTLDTRPGRASTSAAAPAGSAGHLP